MGWATTGTVLVSWRALDDTGITVQLWNLQPDGKTAVRADVLVSNIPAALRGRQLSVQRYLIDSQHSNALASAGPRPAWNC